MKKILILFFLLIPILSPAVATKYVGNFWGDGSNLTNDNYGSGIELTNMMSQSLNLVDGVSNLVAKAKTTNAMRWLWLGDSEGLLTFFTVKHRLQLQGIGGTAPATFLVGETDWYPQFSTETTTDASLWWIPSGIYQRTNGAFRIWNANGGYATGNMAFLWYPQCQTNSFITLQTSPDATTWTTRLAVNGSNGTTRGLAYTNVALPNGGYQVRMIYTNTTTGLYCYDIWAGIEDTNSVSARVSACAAGGSGLNNFMAMGTNSIRLLLTNLNPNAIIYQQYKPLSTQTNGEWEGFRFCVASFAPNASVIIPSFNAANPTNDVTSGDSASLLKINTDVCTSNNWCHIDNYSGNSFTNGAQLRLYTDGVHMYSQIGYQWNGDQLAEAINLDGIINYHNYAVLNATVLTNNWNNGIMNSYTSVLANALGAPARIGGIASSESTFAGQGYTLSFSSAALFYDSTHTYLNGNADVSMRINNSDVMKLFAVGAVGVVTNYTAENFIPTSGFTKLVSSNNAIYSVSTTKTNLIVAP